jgi:hypothetical protein
VQYLYKRLALRKCTVAADFPEAWSTTFIARVRGCIFVTRISSTACPAKDCSPAYAVLKFQALDLGMRQVPAQLTLNRGSELSDTLSAELLQPHPRSLEARTLPASDRWLDYRTDALGEGCKFKISHEELQYRSI